MPTICPSCHHIRQPQADAPDWQCPSCGVAYAKAVPAGGPQLTIMRNDLFRPTPEPAWDWRKWLSIAAMACAAGAAWYGWGRLPGGADGGAGAGAAELNASEMQALAARVKDGDIVLYTTTTCPYCAQAKAWLQSNGLAYTECDTSVDMRCGHEFQAHNGRGVPLVVVRGEALGQGGFDSDELLAALARR